ncbi:TPA: helix-turn-helix domain-containing protein [Photobacterium damselae]
MFAQILFRYREKHQLTQDQVVYRLASKFDEFAKLDCVTFSRWENGRTEPSLKKIFLILSEIGYAEDYFNYLLTNKKNYKYPILDNLLDLNYNRHVIYRTSQYLNVYNYDLSNIKITICCFMELPEKLKTIILSSDLSNIDKYDAYNIRCVYLVYENEILGYSLFNDIFYDQFNAKEYWELYEVFDNSNGFVHFKQLALTRETWSILFLYHYLYLLNNIGHYKNTYSLNFENNFYSIFSKLGAYKVTQFDFLSNDGEYSYTLICMDTIAFLSNKNILGLVIDTYRILCDRNINLLNDIINSIRG